MENIIKSYGRIRSRGLSDAQKDHLTVGYKMYGINISDGIVNPHDLFDTKYDSVFFEIGFGNGEHMIYMAQKYPKTAFIGCEPFENGVATAIRYIKELNLKNIKIFRGDARELLAKLQNHSINRCYILFPDPWRKKRHHKRRIINSQFLNFLKEKLSASSELRIATDHADYLQQILVELKVSNFYFNENIIFERPTDFSGTKYEQKAIDAGRRCAYIVAKNH